MSGTAPSLLFYHSFVHLHACRPCYPCPTYQCASVSGLTSTTQARATVRAYVGNGTLSSFIQAQMAAYRTAYDRPVALRAAAQALDPGAD